MTLRQAHDEKAKAFRHLACAAFHERRGLPGQEQAKQERQSAVLAFRKAAQYLRLDLYL